MTEQRTDLESLRSQADDPTEEQIIAEIEVTRTEMSGTIDQIGHRLSPQVIADQAREQIREATVGRVERMVHEASDTAQQTGNTIIGTIRQNPVPAALAAVGIGWLALRMRDQQYADRHGNGRRGAPRQWYAHDTASGQGSYGVGEAYGTTAQSAGGESVADQLSERGREMGDQAQRAAQDVAQQAQETWQDVQWKAQDQAQNLQRQFDRTLDENPLALGALAVGVGAAVALAIPETEQERQIMGEQRDKILSEVESAASRALSEAEQGAREAGEQVRQETQSQSQ